MTNDREDLPLGQGAWTLDDSGDLKSRGGVHKLTYGLKDRTRMDVQITVTVSRVKEASSGSTSAEFSVTATGDKIPTFKLTWNQNMLALRSRASAGKDLAGADGVYLDEDAWKHVIQLTCQRVLERHRQGVPSIALIDQDSPSEGRQWRLGPLLEDKEHSLLFGDGNAGKSFLATLAGFLVVTGREALGMKPQQGNVLYCDYETNPRTAADRLKMIAAGYGESKPDFFRYLPMVQTLANDFERVNREVELHSIDLVIVDSAAAATGEPELSGPTNEYFRALNGLECTTLTIAHVAKTGKEIAPFGSAFWRNLPRSNFRVESKQDHAGLKIGLRHTKSNNGPPEADRAFAFAFSDDMITVSTANPDDVDGMEAGAPLAQRITKLINSDGAKTIPEIAAALDSPQAVIRTTIGRITGMGRLSDGRYGWKT